MTLSARSWTALLTVVLAVGVLGAPAAQAQRATASASISPTRIGIGQQVRFTLVLRGTTGGSIPTPEPSVGLRALQSGPATDVTTRINGLTERELTWVYEAVSPGVARIGPVRVSLGNGQTLSVAPAIVRVSNSSGVVPGAPPRTPSRPPPRTQPGAPSASSARPAPSQSSDLFARIELSRESAVVGQQIVADVVLYFADALQPRQTMVTGSWDAPGFWREELDVASTVPHSVSLGGRAFQAVTLRRLALFPTRDGRLELPPMTFSVDLLQSDPFNDPFGRFFSPFSSGFEEREVTTPGATLDVSALPPGAPAGFGGAVGQFTMTMAPVQTTVASGDPVQVRISVSGNGNIATLDEPQVSPPPGLDSFRPRNESDIDRAAQSLRGVKTFTFTLVPQGGGQYDVPPAVWSYFDPETGTYRTLRTDSLQLDVSGVPAAAVADRADVPTGPIADLIAPPTWSRPGPPVGILWGVLGAGLGLPAVALAAAALVRRRRARLAADTPEGRRRRALAEARGRLAKAHDLGGTETYAEARRTVDAFLLDRFGLAAAPLARPDLAVELDARGVPETPRLLALLDALDAGQYAPGLARLGPDAVLAEADAVLTSLAVEPKRARRARRAKATVAAALALFALAHAPGAHAQTVEEADRLFETGTRIAAEGDTAGATAAFEGAVEAGRSAGRVSAAAEHNLGTLALTRGDAGAARLHTERAARLAPLDKSITQNAALARALAGAPAETSAARAWRTARSVAGPTGLVALALALVYAALGLGLGGRRRAAGVVGVLGAVAVVAAVGALVQASRTEGVALAAVDVHADPAPDAPSAGALAPGVVVRLGETRGAWRHVTSDDAEGWAPSEAVEAL